MGRQAVVPQELKGFNWGAFLWSWIWSIAHKTWIGLLSLVPVIGVIVWFALGFKGNEWGWRSRRWESVEHFRQVQQKWTRWGVVGIVVSLGVGTVVGIQLVLPEVQRARTNAVTASSGSNLKQLGLALLQYSEDNDEKFPSMQDATVVKSALLPYVGQQNTTEDIFLQPATGEPYQPNAALSGRSWAEIESPAETVTLHETVPRPDKKRNVLFADGHVELLNEADWQRVQQASKLLQSGSPTSATPDPAANKPRFVILRGSYKTETIADQALDAEAYCDDSSVRLSESDKKQVRVGAWTLQVKNPTDQDITAISFRATYKKADGTAVQPETGLKKWTGCGLHSRFGFRRLSNIKWKLAAGSERRLILYDLVSKQASEQLRKGKGNIVVWADQLESASESAAGDATDASGTDAGSTDGDGTTQGAVDESTMSGGSDLERYINKLNGAPHMNMFVSGVSPMSEGMIKITMTSEYHTLPYHDRLRLAKILSELWQSEHAPNNPERAWIVLAAANGTTVGGQSVTGTVWVEE